MNTIQRRLIGLLSSLLAIAGLCRIAERLDPVSQTVGNDYALQAIDTTPTQSCALPCVYSPNPKFHEEA